jgi:predicted NUDIX family NTP pyrophosphohydrolase
LTGSPAATWWDGGWTVPPGTSFCGSLPVMKVSAGLLLYRRRDGRIEVLLAHPGGPLWERKDAGAWSLPKGEADAGESDDEGLLAVARREFEEETGQVPPTGEAIQLGDVRLRSGKTIRAWAVEGDLDAAAIISSTFELEWPPRSGRRATYPEVDRVAWSTPDEARQRLNPAQVAFVERLLEALD